MGMTIDEIIAQLKKLKSFHNGSYGASINFAMEALKQGLILDKIKSEIKDWQTDIHDNEYNAEKHDFVFERIYEIIDKYNAESGD